MPPLPYAARRIVSPSQLSATVPSRSVRSRWATPESAESVSLDGWPYELPAPTEMTAQPGENAPASCCVVEVLDPWCPTLSTSTGRSSSSSTWG